MRKFIAFFCCLALMLSITSVSAFAAEPTAPANSLEALSTDTVSPRVSTQGLWYKENWYFVGVQSFSVTPESSASLNVWLENNDTVILTVYKTTVLGTYSKVYQGNF